MEKYRSPANFNGGGFPHQRPNFHSSSATPYIPFPPKPNLREPYLMRPEASRARRPDEPEISIFNAERYFNACVLDVAAAVAVERCDLSTNPRDSSVSSVDGRNHRKGSFTATPTASSEASWNSQSVLLTKPPGSLAVNVRAHPLQDQRKWSSFRRLFHRSCPCSGKKSVGVRAEYSEPSSPICSEAPKIQTLEVDEDQEKIERKKLEVEEVTKLKIVAGNWSKDEKVLFSPVKHFQPEIARRCFKNGGGFSFPVLTPHAEDPIDEDDDPARDSLEVYRPMNLRDRRSMDDDAGSDTSSDLFEIESFSTGIDSRRILQMRRSLESATGAAPSVAGSDCYAPSEVSVQWSVTTAEGFDRGSAANFSSAASEYEELRFIQAEHDRFAASVSGGGGGGKRRGTGLLSCVSEKAVSVGPTPVRFGPEQRRTEGGVLSAKPGVGMTLDRTGLSRSYSGRMNRTVQIR